jgi:hypothetical protein
MRRILTAVLAFGLLAWISAAYVPADVSVPGLADDNGDANADGVVDMTDAIHLLNFLYTGGPAPRPLKCEPFADFHNGDVNGDSKLDISDPIYLLSWEFLGGPGPVKGCP